MDEMPPQETAAVLLWHICAAGHTVQFPHHAMAYGASNQRGGLQHIRNHD